MRASEDQRVDVILKHIVQIPHDDLVRHRVVGPAFLHQRNQQRTRFADDADLRPDRVDRLRIGSGGDRCLRRDHADPAVFRRLACDARTRVDHADHGHSFRLFLHDIDRVRRRRIAGDHDRLDFLSFKKADDLSCVSLNRRLRFVPVRHARGVAEIDDFFHRKVPHDLPRHRQSAEAGIKHADRGFSLSAHETPPLFSLRQSGGRCSGTDCRYEAL